MRQPAWPSNQPFTLQPFQIWNRLEYRHKSILTVVYRLDQEILCQERHHTYHSPPGPPSDDWRWIPYTARSPAESVVLKTHLDQIGITSREVPGILQALEMQGLLRCRQDQWAPDDRLFVRILFLGQRTVRAGVTP